MADTTEKIIFNVQIDQSDAIAKVAGLTKEINSLKDANANLAKAEGDNSKAIAENNVLIQLATNERSKTNKAIVASVEAFGKEAKSIDDARTAVKQLTIERNKLDLKTDEGKAKQKELNKSIDEHNKFIRENVDQYQQQKINIGNYTSALSGIKGPIGNAIQGLQSMKSGFDAASEGINKADINMKSLSGIFKANIFSLVMVALSGLIALFSRFEPIIEKVEFIFSGISQAADVLISRFIDVGKAIANLDFTNFGLNLKGVASEMKNAYNEGYKLAQMFDQIEEAQTDGVISQSKYERAVASLNVELKNKTKTQSELLAISDKIAALDKAEIERKLQIADKEVKAFAIRNSAAIKNQKINEDMRKEFVNAYAQREKIQQEFEVATERRENRVDAINKKFKDKKEAEDAKKLANQQKQQANQDAFLEKQIAADQKIVAEADKALQKTLKDREDAFNKENNLLKNKQKQEEILRTQNLANGLITQKQFESQQLLAKEKALEEQIEVNKKYYRNTTDSELALAQTKLEINKKSTEDKKKFSEADIASSVAVANATKSVIGELASAATQGSDLQKALALTNVAINLGTAIGNLTATTSAPSPDNLATGGIAGFVKYAAGLVQIIGAITSARNIIGGAAAGGGDFMTNGPTMLLVGDNPGGRERVTVEPISGKGQTTINPNSGLVAMAGGGTLTTSGYGGFAERNSGLKTMIDYNLLAKAVAKQPAPILQLSELNKKQNDLDNVNKKINLSV
jgi:colicin import membrane protein